MEHGGVAPRVKLCQNLSVSSENELMNTGMYRVHAVLASLGHSCGTSSINYLDLNDDDFDAIGDEKLSYLTPPILES